MNLTVCILDDEAHAIEQLKAYITQTPGLELAGSATDPIKLMGTLTGTNPPELLLLDVDMPTMSGLEISSLLHKETSIVFVTAYREFGADAFELNAVDYLLKPISYARFFNAIQKVRQVRKKTPVPIKEQHILFVKGDSKEKYLRVVTSDIQFIRAALNYVEIHFANEKIITYLTLAEILAELPANDFCQIHRSYIVSKIWIKAIENGQLRMENNELIPFGKSYQEHFLQWINSNILISKRIRH